MDSGVNPADYRKQRMLGEVYGAKVVEVPNKYK